MAKERSEVAKEDCWNVEALYPNLEAWEKEYREAGLNVEKPTWPKITQYQGKLAESPQTFKNALEEILNTGRKLSALYTYAHLRHDENITDEKHKAAYKKIVNCLTEFGFACAWFEPELLSLPDDVIQKAMNSKELKDYKFHIEKIVRIKKHMLSKEQEELLAMAGNALQAPHRAFSAINDADFKFGSVEDNKGKKLDLTHASFGIFVRSHDRALRKNAFTQMHGKYHSYQNTLCELLNGETQGHVFNARARNFSSCLEAALFPKNIDTKVYHSLIQAVSENIHALHRYIALREKVLGIGQLHLYDMHVPLTSEIDIKMSYKEAEDIVIESVKPLGSEYQEILQKGLKEQRWADRYENKGKRSGAYSSGCFDSMPYILMNYKELLRDVFTLAHEAGHSMHSYYSHKNQLYQYSDYPIFLAEVASTFNEELLMRLLLQQAASKAEKIYLINQKIEDIRGTLFRQTMFAEFELFLHEMAEKNVPLTPELLNKKYHELNAKYFGPNVALDAEGDSEWARIPHFYYNFYVFQYATGISAALALADRVVNGGEKERDQYLSFLKAGSSKYPIDILIDAGVDMRTPEPVTSAIHKFDTLVTELEKLTM